MPVRTKHCSKVLSTVSIRFAFLQIINPKTKRGFVHKGVPIPVPPEDVLKERRSTDEHLYLVLFFDARRTWLVRCLIIRNFAAC